MKQKSLFKDDNYTPNPKDFKKALEEEFLASRKPLPPLKSGVKRKSRADSIFLPEETHKIATLSLGGTLEHVSGYYPPGTFPQISTAKSDVIGILNSGELRIGLDFEFRTSNYRPSIIGVSLKNFTAGCIWDRDCGEALRAAIDRGVVFVGHFVLGADKEVLDKALNINTLRSSWEDSMILHYLCSASLCKAPGKEGDGEGAMGFMSLGFAAHLWTNLPAYKNCIGVGCDTLRRVCPSHSSIKYCAVDAWAGLEIADRCWEFMNSRNIPRRVYDEHAELALDFCLASEKRGIDVNRPLVEVIENQIEEKKEALFPLNNDKFNPRSNIQILKWFNDHGVKLKDVQKMTIRTELERRLEKYTSVPVEEFSEPEILDYVDKTLYDLYIYKESGKGLKPWFDDKYFDSSGKIHPRFVFTGASTMRLCVARGTPVEMPRDSREFPKGIPIENVKVGDLVYTYDDNLNLTLRPVRWVGKTGIKKVVRVHWRSSQNYRKGYVDLTPEHRVRLSTGEYVEAKNLLEGDSVLSLCRGINNNGYSRLWATGHKEITREHRFILEILGKDIKGKHVHHVDENKLNNKLTNLEVLNPSSHTSSHTTKMYSNPSLRKAVSDKLKQLRKDNPEKWNKAKRYGSDNPSYLGLTEEYLITTFMKYGKMTAFRDIEGYDYETIQRYFTKYNLDWKELKRQRNREMGVANNHKIVAIEYLEEEVDVYDLEVEETHNFIAGELCVHNSSSGPNLQNVSARGWGKDVKRAIIPPKGKKFISSDASNLEHRICLQNAGVDPKDIEKDAFMWLVKQSNGAFKKGAEALGMTERSLAKMASHSSNYLAGIKLYESYEIGTYTIQEELKNNSLLLFEDWIYCNKIVGFTGIRLAQALFNYQNFDPKEVKLKKRADALEIQKAYFDNFPIRSWHRSLLAQAERGYVQTRWGSYLELIEDETENAKIAAAKIGQGEGAEYVQGMQLQYLRSMPKDVDMIAQVHDEILFAVPLEWTEDQIRRFVAPLSEEYSHRLPGFLCPWVSKVGLNWGEVVKLEEK